MLAIIFYETQLDYRYYYTPVLSVIIHIKCRVLECSTRGRFFGVFNPWPCFGVFNTCMLKTPIVYFAKEYSIRIVSCYRRQIFIFPSQLPLPFLR